MPPLHAIAAGDLADWLLLHPAFDVDDGLGAGQPRFFNHWGLSEGRGGWTIDGRPFVWQRLTFPQRARFDVGSLPTFAYSDYHIGDRVSLQRDTAWGSVPRARYLARQGDFSDIYSEILFRRRFRDRFGIDLAATFVRGDGRFILDDRNTRHLHLETVGPLVKETFWSWRFEQFRDQSDVYTPGIRSLASDTFALSQIHPQRDDLLWRMGASVHRPADGQTGWIAGVEIQSGRQDLRDKRLLERINYRLMSRDQRYSVWGMTDIGSWHLDGQALYERFDLHPVEADRWGLELSGGRTWSVSDHWTVLTRLGLSDYDTDPPAADLAGVLSPSPNASPWLPTVRVERRRTAPTLFDRNRPEYQMGPEQYDLSAAYYESGNPDLASQRENAISARWTGYGDTTGAIARVDVEMRAAYVQDYFRWEDTSFADTVFRYTPVANDARTVGAAVGMTGSLGLGLTYLLNYAAKYAGTLSGTRLMGYYPHKASAMLTWTGPLWQTGLNLQLSALGHWWYGDRRIDPTAYESPHVLRVDLSGSATMKALTLHWQLQNAAGFLYRTAPAYDFTGRMLRFGIEWQFLD